MKLHQLRYLAAVAQSGLNITAAAQKLHTSQPGVSKQIKLLEDELGFQIFVREGRNLTRITPAGQQVIDRALRILQEAQSIRDLSTELRDEGRGSLSIGTTHTQARYVLPDVIRQFRGRYPQRAAEPAPGHLRADRRDGGARSHRLRDRHRLRHLFSDLTLLPCYRWHRTVIVPHDHPLASAGRLTFQALAAYPLVTYTFSFTGPSSLHEAFAKAGLTPNVAITARDADVIQTYVRLGLGVGIVAHMAVDGRRPRPDLHRRRAPVCRRIRPGSASAAERCCASTCTTSRSFSRRTSTGAWSTARTARPPRRRSRRCSRISSCRCARCIETGRGRTTERP